MFVNSTPLLNQKQSNTFVKYLGNKINSTQKLYKNKNLVNLLAETFSKKLIQPR